MGAINRKGCTCASCRSPAVVARLALDEADRLEQALRRKYRTPADALSALGLDESVLDEEGERTMPKLSYDARSRDMMRRGDQEEEEMSGYDRRRGRDMRSRDQEMEPGEEREDDLEELIRELSGEDRRMVTDA